VGWFMESPPYFARIGTINRDRAVVGQPSRLSSRASRPRRILGRDAPGGRRDACPTTTRFMESAIREPNVRQNLVRSDYRFVANHPSKFHVRSGFSRVL